MYVIHAKPPKRAKHERQDVDMRGLRALLKRIGRDYGLRCTLVKWEDRQDAVDSERS